jgi:hypothetical protein
MSSTYVCVVQISTESTGKPPEKQLGRLEEQLHEKEKQAHCIALEHLYAFLLAEGL